MRWTLRGDAGLFERERARLDELLRSGRSWLERREDLSPACFLKAGPLRGRAALRHAARRALGARLPRLAEFDNLGWLRAHGFDAPRPVLAGALWRAGLPRFQFLYTEALAVCSTLERLVEGNDARADAAALAAARVAARLHAQGFVHRDFFARNLLVAGAAGAPRVHVLDAWRGGPRRGLRGPAYDVGCLVHDLAARGAGRLAPAVRAAYAAERARLGRPVGAGFERAVARAAAARARRDARSARKRAARGAPA